METTAGATRSQLYTSPTSAAPVSVTEALCPLLVVPEQREI